MYIDFSRLFHESSKDLLGGGSVYIHKDEERWPEEWKIVDYKKYSRMPKLELPAVEQKRPHFKLVAARKSQRDFSGKPVDVHDLSALLKYSCGIMQTFENRKPRRAHPSGGARYPLEIYPLVLAGSREIPAGVYHYDVREHALDALWQRSFAQEDIDALFAYEWVRAAPIAIIMTAVFSRTQKKYGERGYRYALLEAGHVGQNVYLVSSALGMKCCSIVGTYDTAIEKLLDIDGVEESVVYTVIVG